MRYLPLTEADRGAMLEAIGVASIDALFAEVPPAARLDGLLDLPRSAGEIEVERAIGHMASRNLAAGAAPFFVGGGAYRHHVPAAGQPSDPARRVSDLLHPLPAGDIARDPAISVRVPDAGGAADRHGGRQRLDV